MPEWLKDFLVAVGGGTVVLVGILTIFKKIFFKFLETGIDSSFEKNLVKYRNKLSRSDKAYEILLDREMRFYEKIEPIFAELIPLLHDLTYNLKKDKLVDREKQIENYRELFERYVILIKTIKNETLLHQSYIPKSVFMSSSSIVQQMEDNVKFWYDMAMLLFAGEYDKIDYNTGEKNIDAVLKNLAATELSIKNRLNELSDLS